MLFTFIFKVQFLQYLKEPSYIFSIEGSADLLKADLSYNLQS